MKDSPQTGVFVSRFVWEGREPLLGLRHDHEGDWILWGQTEPTDENGVETDLDLLLYVHLEHVVDRFPEVATLADLKRDRSAIRASPDDEFIEAD